MSQSPIKSVNHNTHSPFVIPEGELKTLKAHIENRCSASMTKGGYSRIISSTQGHHECKL